MQDWLVGIVGSDLAPLASILLSALIVVALAVLAIGLMRRAMRGGIGFGNSDGPRIEVLDVTSVDPKRKLVLVRRDQVEHLLLIGGGNDLVIEARIGRPAAPPPRRTDGGFPDEPSAAFPRPGVPQPQRTAGPPVAREPRPTADAAPAPRVPMPAEPRHDPRAEIRPEPRGGVHDAPAVEIAPPAPSRAPAEPAGRTGRVEPSLPFAEAPEPPQRPKAPVAADRPQAIVPPPQERALPDRPFPERATAREAPEVQTERRSMATPTIAAPQVQRVEPRAATPREVSPPVEIAAPQRPRPDGTPSRTEPVSGPALGALGRPIATPPPVDAPQRAVSPVQAETADTVGTVGTPDPRAEDRPLTVRSFASVISERQRPAPAAPAAQAAPAASPAPAPAPVVAAAPKAVAAPIVAAEPAREAERPSSPTPASPPTDEDDDDLAQLLSRELAADEADEANADPLFSASDTLETSDWPSSETKPKAAEPGKESSREITIEEEMERLMRDFAAHTTDRR